MSRSLKPKHLDPRYADQFKDQGVVDAYPCRQPYPKETYPILSDLVVGARRDVLDVGCGSGDIARRLVQLVDRVDAVDFSHAMIASGKVDLPHLNGHPE